MKRNSRRFVRKSNQQNEKSHSPFFNLAHNESNHPSAFFQTQLKTGEKDDKYEKEADQAAAKIASKVPLTPEPVVQKQDISAVQMSSMKENEEKPVQKQMEEKEKPVQKMEDKKEEKPVQKEEKKEEKPIQKEEKKELEKPVQKEEKKEEKPIQKEEKKEEEKPVQKAEAEENKDVQAKSEENNVHPPIMRKKKKGNGTDKSSDIPERIKKTKGKGQPMSEKTARHMENAFGADFSNVTIHTDEQSASLNKDLQSVAFTNGSDIYFADGQYNPDSSSGQTLLAHELAHVIQQTGK